MRLTLRWDGVSSFVVSVEGLLWEFLRFAANGCGGFELVPFH
jgi:hypothetical protein